MLPDNLMGRKRKSPEKPRKGLGRKAKKQQPPEIPALLKDAKGSLPMLYEVKSNYFIVGYD